MKANLNTQFEKANREYNEQQRLCNSLKSEMQAKGRERAEYSSRLDSVKKEVFFYFLFLFLFLKNLFFLSRHYCFSLMYPYFEC
jgi:hypothetical protein